MAAPKTWVAFELLTASEFNTEFRDRLTAIATSKGLVMGIGDFRGAPLTTGLAAYFEVPFPLRITGWTLLADAIGDIVLDVWRDSYANFPPTVADTITGTEKPTLSGGVQKAQDLALGTWSPDLNAGDVLGINVVSTSGVVKAAFLTLRGVHRDFV